MLLVFHRYNTVRDADHIHVLHDGRIIEHGSHDKLIAAGGTYAELFTLQAAAYTGHAQPNGHRPDHSRPAGTPTPDPPPTLSHDR